MFDLRKFGQLVAPSSVFVGSFLIVLSATATNDVVKTEKLEQQGAVILASSDTEKLRSQQQANIELEQLEVPMRSDSVGNEFPDTNFENYNMVVRAIQNLPSNGQSTEISSEDNNIQRLLKQQVNDSLKIYQIIGQLLDAGKLDSLDSNALSFIDDWHLPFYQGVLIAIAETNLATNTDNQLLANNTCWGSAKEGEKSTQIFEQAGFGTRSEVMIANYLRRYCEIQRLKLGFGERDDTISNAIRDTLRKTQSQQPIPIDLAESERFITEIQQEHDIRAPRIDYYKTTITLLQKLSSKGQSLAIHTEDNDIQKLQKQQLYNALEIYRLQGLRLTAGLLNDNSDAGEIMLPAILIAISNMNLATKPNERAVANKVCLEIAQAWEKDVFAQRKTALNTRIKILTVNYWKRQCNIQKLQTDKI